MKSALSIAGSDSGGGAGIQADLLTFAANGVYGSTAIAACTAQNPNAVSDISALSPDFLAAQIRTVYDFYKPSAVKTGMLFSRSLIETVCEQTHDTENLVVDPVMISTSGSRLLEVDACEAMAKKLIPSARVFTPNLDEASFLLGGAKIVPANIAEYAGKLAAKFGTSVLLKGGHLESDELSDVLCRSDGEIFIFRSKRIYGVDTHGSGCTLSAAIAAGLAVGLPLESACASACAYLGRALANPVNIGGRKFINHFPDYA